MRKLLVSTAQIAVAAVLLLTAPLAYAQDGGKMAPGKMHSGKMAGKMHHGGAMAMNGCTMKDGKMMMMQGGKMMPMTKDMTMSDGSMCMTDGTCKMKDGTTMKMKDGQCMMMDGKMTTMDAMKKGGKMKHSGKMGAMKM